MFNIVLHQPEIPQNTGSIGRLCVNNNCRLHLIRPLGFEISDYYLRRSGLDYWEKLDPYFYDNWEDFKNKNMSMRLFLFSTKGARKHTEVDWQ
ncbi:MAG: tRNA (cytidine(34)-2'-O)-methyltransferase, partial [Holophagaceae bacterium]